MCFHRAAVGLGLFYLFRLFVSPLKPLQAPMAQLWLRDVGVVLFGQCVRDLLCSDLSQSLIDLLLKVMSKKKEEAMVGFPF